MQKIALIGQGGHSKVITDIIHEKRLHQIIAIFDDKYTNLKKNQEIYYGPISSVKLLLNKLEFKLIVAIGDNIARKKIVQQLQLPTEKYETLIHPTAIISNSATIGRGTVIMPNAVINAATHIGNHTIINTGSIIEHDNRIDNFVHVSPNTTLTGTVTINEGTHIGAGATVIPKILIDQWSIIGAGATVIKDIPSFCTAVGSPAKIIKSTSLLLEV